MPSIPSSFLDTLYGRGQQKKKQQRLIRILIGVFMGSLVFLLAAFLLWQIDFWSSPQESHPVEVNIEELPHIRASTEPYKKSPQDPGGIYIPHQDKEIYKRVKEAKAPKGILEKKEQNTILLPLPEAPLETEDRKEEGQKIDIFEKFISNSFDDLENFWDKQEGASSQDKQATHMLSLEKNGPLYFIKIGEKLRSREEAYQEWRHLSLKYGEQLKNVSLSIVPISQDVSESGGFQLFLGRFKDKETPEALCSLLHKEGTSCMMYYKEK